MSVDLDEATSKFVSLERVLRIFSDHDSHIAYLGQASPVVE